jgi:hypothetical protein
VIDFSQLKFYAVMNSEGQLLRTRGQGGGGLTWVDDVMKAKIYPRPGAARSRITFFSNAYPNYPAPKLVEFSIGEIKILDEVERLNKAKQTFIKAQIEREKNGIEFMQEKIKTGHYFIRDKEWYDREIKNKQQHVNMLEKELECLA